MFSLSQYLLSFPADYFSLYLTSCNILGTNCSSSTKSITLLHSYWLCTLHIYNGGRVPASHKDPNPPGIWTPSSLTYSITLFLQLPHFNLTPNPFFMASFSLFTDSIPWQTPLIIFSPLFSWCLQLKPISMQSSTKNFLEELSSETCNLDLPFFLLWLQFGSKMAESNMLMLNFNQFCKSAFHEDYTNAYYHQKVLFPPYTWYIERFNKKPILSLCGKSSVIVN